MPLFLIAILISLIFNGAIKLVEMVTATITLEPEDIDYITIEPDLNMSYYNDIYKFKDLIAYEIKIDDKETLNTVSVALSKISEGKYNNTSEYYSTPIAIHSGNKVYYRNIRMCYYIYLHLFWIELQKLY